MKSSFFSLVLFFQSLLFAKAEVGDISQKDRIWLMGSNCLSKDFSQKLQILNAEFINMTCIVRGGVLGQIHILKQVNEQNKPNKVIYIIGKQGHVFFDYLRVEKFANVKFNFFQNVLNLWKLFIAEGFSHKARESLVWTSLRSDLQKFVDFCRRNKCEVVLLLPDQAYATKQMLQQLYADDKMQAKWFSIFIPNMSVDIRPIAQQGTDKDIKVLLYEADREDKVFKRIIEFIRN